MTEIDVTVTLVCRTTIGIWGLVQYFGWKLLMYECRAPHFSGVRFLRGDTHSGSSPVLVYLHAVGAGGVNTNYHAGLNVSYHTST